MSLLFYMLYVFTLYFCCYMSGQINSKSQWLGKIEVYFSLVIHVSWGSAPHYFHSRTRLEEQFLPSKCQFDGRGKDTGGTHGLV